MPLAIDLSGRTAVVTGAGSGIGAAIAHVLAAAGASVAAADLDADAATVTAEAIQEEGGTAGAFAADVTDAASVDALRAGVEAAFGRASIVVNNAGWGEPGPSSRTRRRSGRRSWRSTSWGRSS